MTFTWHNRLTVKAANLKPGDRITYKHASIKYVAVIGYANDYAVYCGFIGRTDDDIARNGDKIGALAAKTFFPACKDLHYRW